MKRIHHSETPLIMLRRDLLLSSSVAVLTLLFDEACGSATETGATNGSGAGGTGAGGQNDAALGSDAENSAPETSTGDAGAVDGSLGDLLLDATPQCAEVKTDDNIEGPFYRPGAPEQSMLADDATPGIKLRLSGRVIGQDCRPIAGALLDVWQANSDAAYDAVGFAFRGKVIVGADGSYEIHTVIPGHYLNGAQYRPAHIHAKVSAPGFVPLTTQLYFDGDPYNGIDPFIKPSLIMTLQDAVGDGTVDKQAVFDFVLPLEACASCSDLSASTGYSRSESVSNRSSGWSTLRTRRAF